MAIDSVSKKKICIFGGTFDPIHIGHIGMAKKAADIYGFDHVYVMPTGNSYLKSNVTDTVHRCEMVQLALDEYNTLYNKDLFEISYFEAKSIEPSYTYKTLQYYENTFHDSEIYYLIGEDSLRYIDNWKESAEIFRIANIIVARRINNNKQDQRDIMEVVHFLTDKYSARIDVFDYDNDISSTYIRNAISDRKYELINKYVPSSVIEYIKVNKLYKTGE